MYTHTHIVCACLSSTIGHSFISSSKGRLSLSFYKIGNGCHSRFCSWPRSQWWLEIAEVLPVKESVCGEKLSILPLFSLARASIPQGCCILIPLLQPVPIW